jgi:hypothetical protein
MPTVHETAYPRLKSSVILRELIDLYTPTQAELEVAARASKGESARLGFLVLLKTRGTRDHTQIWNSCQLCDQFIGHTVSEILLVRIARQVLQRKDCDGPDRFGRSVALLKKPSDSDNYQRQQARQNPHAHSEVSIFGFGGRGIRGLCFSFCSSCDLRRLGIYRDRLWPLAGVFLPIPHRNNRCIAAFGDFDAEQIVSTLAVIVFAKTTAQTTRFYPNRCVDCRVILGPSLKYIDCYGVLFGREFANDLLTTYLRKVWLRIAAAKTFDLRMRSTCSETRIGSICVSSVRMKGIRKSFKERAVTRNLRHETS